MEKITYNGKKYSLDYGGILEDGNLVKTELGLYKYYNGMCTNVIDNGEYLVSSLAKGCLIYKRKKKTDGQNNNGEGGTSSSQTN